MGLNTSFDAWNGAYTSFDCFRVAVAMAAGIETRAVVDPLLGALAASLKQPEPEPEEKIVVPNEIVDMSPECMGDWIDEPGGRDLVSALALRLRGSYQIRPHGSVDTPIGGDSIRHRHGVAVGTKRLHPGLQGSVRTSSAHRFSFDEDSRSFTGGNEVSCRSWLRQTGTRRET